MELVVEVHRGAEVDSAAADAEVVVVVVDSAADAEAEEDSRVVDEVVDEDSAVGVVDSRADARLVVVAGHGFLFRVLFCTETRHDQWRCGMRLSYMSALWMSCD